MTDGRPKGRLFCAFGLDSGPVFAHNGAMLAEPLITFAALEAHLDAERTRAGDAAVPELDLARQTVDALRAGRSRLVMLPVLDLETGETLFSETLLRLFDTAGQPIPIFNAMMSLQRWQLTPYVIPHLLGIELKNALETGHAVSLNLPPALLETLESRAQIARVLDRFIAAGGAPGKIILEIMETAFVDPSPTVVAFMKAVGQQGFRWALDDFGDGHHTFDHIRNLPLSYVKLAGGVTSSLLGNRPASNPTVSPGEVVEICGDLRLDMIAEHVPTEDAGRFLRRHYGIRYGHIHGPL
jgi:EAL domain-containing protein (putative c-di-GMP-specific phosphodiesterase class I)